jgi:hypothetical protein
VLSLLLALGCIQEAVVGQGIAVDGVTLLLRALTAEPVPDWRCGGQFNHVAEVALHRFVSPLEKVQLCVPACIHYMWDFTSLALDTSIIFFLNSEAP